MFDKLRGGVIAALEGDVQRALLGVKKIDDVRPGSVAFNFIAYVYNALGDLDSFFEYLNKALEGHSIVVSSLFYSPRQEAIFDIRNLWRNSGDT
jgi:hypothetical protein